MAAAAGHGDGGGNPGGQGVGLAIVAIVIGTGLAVAYVASDGMLLDPVFDLAEPVDASNNGQKSSADSNSNVVDSVVPLRNIFERDPDGREPARQPDTGDNNIEIAPQPRQQEGHGVVDMSGAERQRLMAIQEYPWEILPDDLAAADVQRMIDSLAQREADMPELNQRISGEASPGTSAAASEDVLIKEDDVDYPIIHQEDDNTNDAPENVINAAGIEPEPLPESDSNEEALDVPQQQPPDASSYIPEDGREVLDLIEKELAGLTDIVNSDEEQQENDDQTSDDHDGGGGNSSSGHGPNEEKRSDRGKSESGKHDSSNGER